MARKRIPKIPRLCQRKDGRLYVTDPDAGKQVYFRGVAEYEDWRRAFLSRADVAPAEVPDRLLPGERITVARLCVVYLAHARQWYRKDGQETTEVAVIRMMMRHLDAVLGNWPVDNVRARDIEAVLDRMAGSGLARQTANKLLKKLKTMFRWGVRQEVVSGETLGRVLAVGPLKKGRTAAREKAPVGPVPVETVEATLPALRPTVRAMVLVQLHAGMRPGEVCSLKASEIDRSREPWEYLPARWKTQHHDDGQRRRILFGPRARAELAPFLDKCRDPDSPLFRSRTGRPFSEATYRSTIYHACRKAGVERWSPGQLRHTAATMVREKHGLEAAQVVLGHRKADVTEIYAERNLDLARKIAEELG